MELTKLDVETILRQVRAYSNQKHDTFKYYTYRSVLSYENVLELVKNADKIDSYILMFIPKDYQKDELLDVLIAKNPDILKLWFQTQKNVID